MLLLRNAQLATHSPHGSAAQFDEPIHLMRQENGQFTDVAAELGLDALGSFRAVVASDLNQDGVQDLLITQVAERTLAYISQGCTAANWVAIDAPVGSRVTISAGASTQTDWVRVGRGYQSTSRAPLHFGLGSEAVIDSITVASPGGGVQTFDGPIDARQTLTIQR